MHLYLMVAIGGALGACSRLAIAQWVDKNYASQFALGTLCVNIIGSFLIGIAYVMIVEKAHLPASAKPLIMTGFLGALTTFSTFSLDTLIHIHNGQWLHALSYMMLSFFLCLLATFAAVELFRSIT